MDPDAALLLAAIFIGWILLLAAVLIWMWWHPPVQDDEHSLLDCDPGLAERCRTGSGFGELGK
jgi:hypothetical protein